MAGTKIWCPFYRGVRSIWVSVLRGLTVLLLRSTLFFTRASNFWAEAECSFKNI